MIRDHSLEHLYDLKVSGVLLNDLAQLAFQFSVDFVLVEQVLHKRKLSIITQVFFRFASSHTAFICAEPIVDLEKVTE